MKVEKVTGAYFSPTGNTAKVVDAIGQNVGVKYYQKVDLTKAEDRGKSRTFSAEEVVIVGVPVYRGRMPEAIVEELKGWKGNQTPAVLVVSYGNRMIEDAMIELRDVLEAQGFVAFAAGTFSGQHSFNKEIAYNRPDAKDLAVAKEFGQEIGKKLPTLDLSHIGLVVPGDRPYKKVGPMSQMPFLPETDMNCIYCMICSQYCPMQAISFSNPKAIDKEKCVRCGLCIKVCPVQAKQMTPEPFQAFVKKITTENALSRKEPWYYV
jgi:ferredoxin